MDDYECIKHLSDHLTKHGVKWSDISTETIDTNDDGDKISFYVYFEKPVNIDYNALLDYDNDTFNLKSLELINEELRCELVHKDYDEQILYY